MKWLNSKIDPNDLSVGLTFLALCLIYGWSFWFLGFIGLIFIIQHLNKNNNTSE